MFPTAESIIYYNEDGEVMGWDNESSFEPDWDDYDPYDGTDDDGIDWDDE